MQICRSKQAIRDCVGQWRHQGRPVALVATMGALHEGHLQLLTRARAWLDERGGGHIVTSIFVNPTQFDQAADLIHYPRDEANDLRLLDQADATPHSCPPSMKSIAPARNPWSRSPACRRC